MKKQQTLYERVVEAQAAVGAKWAEAPAGCREVVIARPGRYNDREDRAQALGVGDRLMTREWYARSLVEGGLARWPAEAVPVDVDQVEQAAEGMLAMELARAEEADQALQEAARAPQGKKRAAEGAAAVGKPRSARRKKPKAAASE